MSDLYSTELTEAINKMSEDIKFAQKSAKYLQDTVMNLLESYEEIVKENMNLKIYVNLLVGKEPKYEDIIIGNMTEDYSQEDFNKMVDKIKNPKKE